MNEKTHQSRLKIGFQEPETWQLSPATFGEHSLTIQGHPVMEDWEDGYMKVLADIACTERGAVLEVGFGMGISAKYIQDCVVRSHVIIEANRDVYEAALAFSSNYISDILPVFGFWEDVTADLPSESFDGILFDTYPLSEELIHKNHFPFFTEAYRLLKPEGVFTYYSDEITSFSDVHLQELSSAGFTRIDQFICEVNPPRNCKYWKSKKILAPIIRK